MKNFIFDLDGTLLDTLQDIAGACNHMLEKKGLPVHEVAQYRWMVGNGFETLVKRAIPQDLDWPEEQVRNAVKEARDYYAQNLIRHTRPYGQMPETLQTLAQKGNNLAVLSNKPDPLTKKLIAHFFPGLRFKAVQGAMPDQPLKPDPATVRAIMDQNHWQEEETAYVGDSDVDIDTARNASVMAVGVAWGFRGAAELEKAGADFMAVQPTDLLRLVS